MMDEIFVKTFPGFLSIRNCKHQIVYLNENFRDWIRCYTDVEPLGKNNQEIAALVPENVAAVFLQCHDASLSWQENYGPDQILKKIIPFKDAAGIEENTRYFDVLKYGMFIEDELHIFTVGHDITEVYRESQTYLKRLEYIAYVDELTGEQSFSRFKEVAGQRLKQAVWKSCALIKLDIENFKLINKTYGFDMGDRVLKVLAEVIKSTLRGQEIFARIGVDEFIILCAFQGSDHFDEIRSRFIDKFYELMEARFDYNIRFKVGIYPIDSLVKEADINEPLELVNFAHRKAKQSHGADIVFYDDRFSVDALHQKGIENRMKRALAEGEFLVYLQPKYRLEDESLSGAEALVRWRTSEGKFIYPDEFISIFERNGFIVQLDMYMLNEVCKILSGWMEARYIPVVVSVNFSRLHLNNRNFVLDLCKIVDRFQIERSWIEIEFTETTIYENLEVFEEVLTTLHEAGFTVSMDDFGSGYSSLGLLKNLPVDAIKIDRSFFVKPKDETRTNIVVGSVIDMAKKLGIYTIAEGVEEKVHIDLLRELRCDIVQGYYFARPMPSKEFDRLLDSL